MIANKISVLLIEDDRLAQKMAVIILNQLNCQVKAVANGELALESIQLESFDLIFADVGLPDKDGCTLIEEIRMNSSPNQQVPIIVLSANSDQETIAQSLQAGATDFFVKPLNLLLGQDILKKHVEKLKS